jgi:hypothetical protein
MFVAISCLDASVNELLRLEVVTVWCFLLAHGSSIVKLVFIEAFLLERIELLD